jgi:hypothetical protein
MAALQRTRSLPSQSNCRTCCLPLTRTAEEQTPSLLTPQANISYCVFALVREVTGRGVPIELRDAEDPTLSRQSARRLSALRTGRALLPKNNISLLLVLISVEAE